VQSVRELDRQKRTLSSNIGFGVNMQGCKFEHKSAMSRQFLFGNKQALAYQTERGRSPNSKRACSPISYRGNSQNLISDCTDQRKAIMKEYYRKKKEIEKKYQQMLLSLKQEEIDATKLAVLHTKDLTTIQEKLDEIKEEYALTGNLLQQQKLVEEKETLKWYQNTILHLCPDCI